MVLASSSTRSHGTEEGGAVSSGCVVRGGWAVSSTRKTKRASSTASPSWETAGATSGGEGGIRAEHCTFEMPSPRTRLAPVAAPSVFLESLPLASSILPRVTKKGRSSKAASCTASLSSFAATSSHAPLARKHSSTRRHASSGVRPTASKLLTAGWVGGCSRGAASGANDHATAHLLVLPWAISVVRT